MVLAEVIMQRTELLVVGGLTLLLLIALAITVPVELSNRQHSTVHKTTVGGGRPLRFHLVGDYGQLVNTSDTLSLTAVPIPVEIVAQQMSNRSLVFPIDFITTTGDNVYPNGMKDIFDATQYDLMYHVFDKPGLVGRPWYPVLGNHDCENTPPMLQITDSYPMWNMPSDYYNLTVELDNNATAVLVFLNGCTLACEILPGQGPLIYCDYHFNEEEIDAQYAWLERVLQDANDMKAAWIMVFIHMPPFSAGSGSGDDEALKLRFYPLLEHYNVNFLFAGHEHLAEYMFAPWGQTYIPAPTSYGNCTGYENYYGFHQSDITVSKSLPGLHEIILGSSGHELDQLCPNRTTSMAELIYGTTTWGYVEVTMSSSTVEVNYLIIEQPNPVFTLTVQDID